MSLLAERLLAVHDALEQAGLPHAIGGAIALGYCTAEPRGTRDLDVNVFVAQTRFREVAEALPQGIVITPSDIGLAERDGQVRLMWDDTPVDVFMNNVPFHSEAQKSVREVDFMGRTIPVLGCTALAVFKAMFDRTQDWADIEAMHAVGSVELDEVARWLREMAGPESPRVRRLEQLRAAPS
ncbi:MAG TPA: hypothetical protein VHS55_01065 [Solirubrobacteraceae bacterium]|jgi:hypothetical protein|nr:hypothetical protein [Solirubrobacteraceae bacterium]